MAPDQGFPVLTALVFVPALGAFVVSAIGRDRVAVASWLAVLFAGTTLAVALWALSRADSGVLELHPWMPTLGISFVLQTDGLSAVLVVWVSLATLIVLVSTRPGFPAAVLALGLESAANGLFLAADVFLVFTFLGAAIVVVALASSVPSRVLVPAAAGMTVLFGWFARFYEMAHAQTGFASTGLVRWQSLVLYPGEERALFLFGALGFASLLPAFVIAVDNATREHRLVLLAVAGVIGSFLVLRLLVPLSPRGAEATSSWVLAFAVLLMALAGLFARSKTARGWLWMAIGYQGLVLFGLFSFREDVVIGATLMMMAISMGFFGLALTSSRALVWYFALFLTGMPIASILLPASRGDASWAVAGTLTFAAMAYRLVRSAASMSLDEVANANRLRTVSVFFVVLSSASMIFGWSAWVAHVRPSTASFIAARDGQP